MYKHVFNNTTLTCIQHKKESISTDNCLPGIISRTADGRFRFEEMVRKGRPPRNPKLYDGMFISMVRQKNGKYQLHLKTMDQNTDLKKFAFGVYSEITDALNIISNE